MVNLEYANAYSELLEILKYISKNEYNKIPKEKIEFYKKNANQDYYFAYKPNQTLDEQNTSKITKGIIAILFRDYWATPEQREKIINRQKYDRMQIEKAKEQKYNPNNLFKNNELKSKQELALVEVKKEKWYEKIFSFFKKYIC